MENLLKKVVTAIQEERLDYAIGVLDSVIEMYGRKDTVIAGTQKVDTYPLSGLISINTETTPDEGAMLDAKAKAQMSSVLKMSNMEIQ